MSSDLQIFDFEDNAVRTLIGDNGEILFHGADVCKCLGFQNPRQAMKTHLTDDDVQELDTVDSKGRKNSANFINESGLYSLIFGSTKEEAVRFKRWVTHDVLPQIRKTGVYISDDVALHDTIPETGGADILLDPDIVTHLSLVREARMTWGREAAREIWLKLPLPLPRDVTERPSDDIEGADNICSFLDEVRDETFGGRTQASELYRAYCGYVSRMGQFPLSQRIFGRFAAKLLKRQRFGGYYYYMGCRVA